VLIIEFDVVDVSVCGFVEVGWILVVLAVVTEVV
jgi:hypothetical protein